METMKWEKPDKRCINFLVAAGHQAYKMTDDFMKGDGALLNLTERGQETRPYILNALMDYFVKECCDIGELPFRVEERKNHRNNSPFYLFCGHGIMFTISRVARNGAFPRKADFRNEFSMNNDQLSLFPEIETNRLKEGAYAVLTHGGKEKLEFMRFGLPRAGGRSWIENLNLFDDREPHVAVIPEPIIEVKKPKLKEFLEKRLEDSLK